MKKKVTYASMLHTDGTTTTVGVYRAHLVGEDSRVPFVELTTAELVEAVELPNPHYLPDACAELSRVYATEEWPAFDWTMKKEGKTCRSQQS